MSRPSSEAQYLAGLTPASVAATRLDRRSLLRSAMAGAGLLGATGACMTAGMLWIRAIVNFEG